MAKVNFVRKYGPSKVGVDGASADPSTDGNVIAVNGYDKATFFFEFVGDAGDSATSAITWQVVGGREGSASEYNLTSVSISSGAGTWSDRTETYNLAANGASENFSARYDVADFDWIKLLNVTGTSGDSASTITVYCHITAD